MRAIAYQKNGLDVWLYYSVFEGWIKISPKRAMLFRTVRTLRENLEAYHTANKHMVQASDRS
jgi:predicted solute-binding protein